MSYHSISQKQTWRLASQIIVLPVVNKNCSLSIKKIKKAHISPQHVLQNAYVETLANLIHSRMLVKISSHTLLYTLSNLKIMTWSHDLCAV